MTRIRRLVFAVLVAACWLVASGSSARAQAAPVLCDGLTATLVGTAGADLLLGTDGPDVIAGLQGNDIIDGFGGDDVICGGRGHDRLIGGLGFDIIFGAQGDDEIYSGGTASLFPPFVLEDTRGGRIFAGAGNDIVYGSYRWDRMQGGPGDDTLFGFAGRDWMRGGPGNDVVIGHGGADDLNGGSGNDWVAADNADVAVRAGAGIDLCPNLAGKTAWRGCRNFIDVEASDSTLPSLATFPAELSGGPADAYVYRGYNGIADLVFVGITQDLDRQAVEHGGQFFILELSVTPLERGQARAIEQAFIVANPQLQNQINSISPTHSYYNAAVAWGNRWLALNDLFGAVVR